MLLQLVQGVGIGILTKRYADLPLMRFATITATVAYLLVVSNLLVISHLLG